MHLESNLSYHVLAITSSTSCPPLTHEGNSHTGLNLNSIKSIWKQKPQVREAQRQKFICNVTWSK